MDQWGPKHVELTYVMNKTQSLKNFVYLVGLHIYCILLCLEFIHNIRSIILHKVKSVTFLVTPCFNIVYVVWSIVKFWAAIVRRASPAPTHLLIQESSGRCACILGVLVDRCVVFTRQLCHSFADTEFPRSPLVVDVVTIHANRHKFFVVLIYLCTSFRRAHSD